MTVASYLLYGVAAIQVINALAVFGTVSSVRSAAADVVRGTDSEGAETFVVGVLVASAVISVVIGVGFALLSLFNSRGKNVSRIITWVVGGLSLCCLGAGLGGNALLSNMETSTGGSNGPTEEELQRAVEGATPGWYGPLTTTLTVLALLAILAAVILLALPASNDFFRKPAAGGWDPAYPQGYGQPPYPGQGYPYPGQQAQPGLPPYPGQQGQPGQPAPGLPPYPGQSPSSGPPSSYGPPSGPPSGPSSYGPPPSGPPSPYGPPSSDPPSGPSSYGPPPSDPSPYGPPPASDPFAPPPPPPGGEDRPPRPPTDPA